MWDKFLAHTTNSITLTINFGGDFHTILFSLTIDVCSFDSFIWFSSFCQFYQDIFLILHLYQRGSFSSSTKTKVMHKSHAQNELQTRQPLKHLENMPQTVQLYNLAELEKFTCRVKVGRFHNSVSRMFPNAYIDTCIIRMLPVYTGLCKMMYFLFAVLILN